MDIEPYFPEPSDSTIAKSNVISSNSTATQSEATSRKFQHIDETPNWSLGISFDTNLSPSASSTPYAHEKERQQTREKPQSLSEPPCKKPTLSSLSALSSSPAVVSLTPVPSSNNNSHLTPTPRLLTPRTPFDPHSPSRMPSYLIQPPPSNSQRIENMKATAPTIIVSSMQLNRSQIPVLLQTKMRAETVVCSMACGGKNSCGAFTPELQHSYSKLLSRFWLCRFCG